MMSEEPWPRAGHSLSEQTGNPPAETPQLNIGFVVSDFVVSPEIMEIDPPQSVTENWQRLLDEFVGESVELQPERRATLAHINAVPQPIVTKPGGFIGAHHPSYQQNVISSNKFESEEAFFQTAQGFLLAHQVGALYYVVHPITMDDWTTDRSRQIELALSWVDRLAEFQVQYNLTPKLSIENLEVPKSPASTEEMLYFLRHFSDEGLPIGLVMDIAHHWHNYADLFRYLHSVHLADQELYLDLLSMHLSLLHTHFPEVLIAYHITQSYIDRESNIHVTHGLPGSLEGKPVNFNGLVTNPDSRLEWLSTHDVLQVLKDVAGKHTLPLTRVVLEVHHRAANELLPVAQAMMELWSK